jgi:peroxiredoxin
MQKLLRIVAFFSTALVFAARLPANELADSPAAARPLAVGANAPAVTLTTVEGAEFALGEAFAAKPTVLVFYRGSWCPYCNRQLAALGELEGKLLALGYQIIAISPDSAAGLAAMAGKNHLNYRLLSDRGMIASLAYGLAFRVPADTEKSYRSRGIDLAPIPGGASAWLPVPAVFLIGRDGVIKFAHSDPDYKVRLAPEALLAAAEAAAK